MANPMTEPLDPYEPSEEPAYGWDDDPAADDKPKVLWGRVAVLGGMLILAFLLGRATGSNGIPASELTASQQRVQELRTENAALEEELASVPDPSTDAGTDTETEAGTDEPTDGDTAVAGKTYVVESGDTLTTIAEKFYDDPSLDDFLAEVNGISDPTQLSVGQELLIPDDPPN